jgi:hypothetical protein
LSVTGLPAAVVRVIALGLVGSGAEGFFDMNVTPVTDDSRSTHRTQMA